MKARHIVIMIVAAMVGGGITNWLLREQRAFAASDSIAESIVTKEFRLVDSEGKTRAVLTTMNNGAGLVLFDSKGELKVKLYAKDDSAALNFHDSKGESLAALGVVTNKGEKQPVLKLSKAGNNAECFVRSDIVSFGMEEGGKTQIMLLATQKAAGLFVGDDKANIALQSNYEDCSVVFAKNGKDIWIKSTE